MYRISLFITLSWFTLSISNGCQVPCGGASDAQCVCLQGCGCVKKAPSTDWDTVPTNERCLATSDCPCPDGECRNVAGQCETQTTICNNIGNPCDTNNGGCSSTETCFSNYCNGCNVRCEATDTTTAAPITTAACNDLQCRNGKGECITAVCMADPCNNAKPPCASDEDCSATMCDGPCTPICSKKESEASTSAAPSITCANVLCVQDTMCYETENDGPACCNPDICKRGICNGIGGLQCETGYECVADPVNQCQGQPDCAGICVDVDAMSKCSTVRCSQDRPNCINILENREARCCVAGFIPRECGWTEWNSDTTCIGTVDGITYENECEAKCAGQEECDPVTSSTTQTPTVTCATVLCQQGICYETESGPACCDPQICQRGICNGIGALICADGYECVDDPINPCQAAEDCAGVCVDVDAVSECSTIRCAGNRPNCVSILENSVGRCCVAGFNADECGLTEWRDNTSCIGQVDGTEYENECEAKCAGQVCGTIDTPRETELPRPNNAHSFEISVGIVFVFVMSSWM